MTQKRIRLTKLIKMPKTQQDSLKVIGMGAVFFLFGAIFLVTAERFYEPSLEQEFMALAGLLLGGFGFLVSMLAQLNLIYQRIAKFFLDD